MGLVQGVVGGAEGAPEGAGIHGAEEEVEVSILKQLCMHSRNRMLQRVYTSLLELHIMQLSWLHVSPLRNITVTAGFVTLLHLA